MPIRNLFMLPFDHRASFSRDLLKITGQLDSNQTQKIAKLKNLIFLAFLNTYAKYRNDNFAILVDEQFGGEVIRGCKEFGIEFATSVEKSGQKIFDFEYGTDYQKHLTKINPNYAKVLVRYHPENVQDNEIQLKRLVDLSTFCEKKDIKLLFELLLNPSDKDIEKAGSRENFDNMYRADLMKQAVREVRSVLKPTIWKLEGMNSHEEWDKILSVLSPEEKIIVLGRGENKENVSKWLDIAAKKPNIVGFAIGRTIFYNPLKKYLAKEISESSCVSEIASNFEEFIVEWKNFKSL